MYEDKKVKGSLKKLEPSHTALIDSYLMRCHPQRPSNLFKARSTHPADEFANATAKEVPKINVRKQLAANI